MKLNHYQECAMDTCTQSSYNFSYMFLNLVGEVGEFASKVAKAIRKNQVSINRNHLTDELDEETIKELMKEAGDIMWQFNGLCACLGWDAEDIAQMNLDKLADRKNRGVIVGSGDNR